MSKPNKRFKFFTNDTFKGYGQVKFLLIAEVKKMLSMFNINNLDYSDIDE